MLQQIRNILGQQITAIDEIERRCRELADVFIAIAIAFLDRHPWIARAFAVGTRTTNGLPASGGSTLTMPFGQSGPKVRWNARNGCCGSWKPGTAGQPARAGGVSVPSAIRGYALGGGATSSTTQRSSARNS